MLLETVLDDGQYALVAEAADRVLDGAPVLGEEAAHVIEIGGVEHGGEFTARLPQRRSVGESEPAIQMRHEPDGPDQQELHVLEERRTRALDGVADELAYPRDHENGEAGHP